MYVGSASMLWKSLKAGRVTDWMANLGVLGVTGVFGLSRMTLGVSRVFGGLFGVAVVNGADLGVGRIFWSLGFGAAVDFGVGSVVWGERWVLVSGWSGFLLVVEGLLGAVGSGSVNGLRMPLCFLLVLTG